jgi:phosphatidylglycerophosphate synthase
MTATAAPRRELRTRQARWAGALARWLAARGVRPNAVSVTSVLFALLAGGALWMAGSSEWRSAPLYVMAAAGIQLRLLCNMLDGMLAVEGGMKSALGDIYNDLPDRIADAVILIGAGYSVRDSSWGVTLGWAAALLAVMTAYVRVLGGSLGATQRFLGPMAKQHRMFVLTVACLLAALERTAGWPARAVWWALAIIVAGSLVTTARRVVRIARELAATAR